VNRALLKAQLVKHEGLRRFPYMDTVGKLTIGVGRNLTDRGITEVEAAFLLDDDVTRVEGELRAALHWYDRLDDIRQTVLANMAFNLGTFGLLQFTNTLSLIEHGDYDLAAKHMLKSKWASQVKGRAVELAELMRTAPTKEIHP